MNTNSYSKVFVLLMLFFSFTISPAFSSTNIDNDARLAVLALNYCRNSLVKIQSYNDRVVLDEEYNNIINNIDLSKIKDEEIIDLLEELMDTLSLFKLQESAKKRLIKKHNKKVSNAFYSSFSGSSNILYLGGGNPFAMGALALVQVGGAFVSYRRNITEFREALGDEMWKLEESAIEQINDAQKMFLRSSWNLMQKRDFPDIWRLTDEQLNEFVDILKDEKSDRRLRKLKRISKYFSLYPPYWYFLGTAYLETKNKKEALETFEQFEEVHRGFFRNDNLYTSALMNKISLLNAKNNKDEMENLLGRMTDQIMHDWRKILFAALKYTELGNYTKAKNLLQINIDNENNISLNMRVLGEIYILEKDSKKINELMDKMVEEDKVRNQDILYLVGKLPEIKKLNIIKDQILNIDVKLKEATLSSDKLEVFVPIKWILDDFVSLKISLNINGNDYIPSSVMTDEIRDGAVYMFDDFDFLNESLAQTNSLETEIIIKHLSSPIVLKGKIINKCREIEKGSIDKGIDKAKNLIGKYWKSKKPKKTSVTKTVCEPVFIKEKVMTKISEYIITNSGSIKKHIK